MKDLEKLFKDLFKFEVHQDVRHKGDTKSHMADMGLLVLERRIIETEDDDGNKIYNRQYVCRMTRFSGSGDLAAFKESELMSIEEYNVLSIKRENQRNEQRDKLRQMEKEIYTYFGVAKGVEVRLKGVEGIDEKVILKPCGFEKTEGKAKIRLRIIEGQSCEFKDEILIDDPKKIIL